MTKRATISDLHLSYNPNESFSKKILENTFRGFDYFLEQCDIRGIKDIDILGDIFDFKDRVHQFALIPAIDYIEEKSDKYNFNMIPGNHEILNKDNADFNFAKIFKSFCKVYSRYTVKEYDTYALHYLPYVQDYNIKDVKLKPVAGKKNILLTHLCLHEMFDKWEDVRYVVSPKFFIEQGMDRIYSGHIHIHGDMGDIVYVSSPNMSNFGEAEDEGRFGFMFMDYQNMTHEFLPNPFSPSFHKFVLTKEIIPTLLKTTNSFISLTIEQEFKQEALIKLLTNLREKNYDVKVKYQLEKRNTQISILKDWEETEAITPDKIDEMYLDHVKMESEKKIKYLNYIKRIKSERN